MFPGCEHMLMQLMSARPYLQVIFSQVLVPPAFFILIEDRWDLGPLWIRIRWIGLQAAVERAGGRRLQEQTDTLQILRVEKTSLEEWETLLSTK